MGASTLEAFATPESWIALLTLTTLEIVLGIDNVVFIAILSGRLPEKQQASARRWGLLGAKGMRIMLLFDISWIMGLTKPFFDVLGKEISGRDLILLAGGLFLIAKATDEIHERIEEAGNPADRPVHTAASSFSGVLIQVMILDMVFSLDSVITAVGMADHMAIMVVAVIIAIIVMMIFADAVSDFIHRYPTMKILALSFLFLIGVMLVAEGFGKHIEKGYIYFAMGFSLFVQFINLHITKKRREARKASESAAPA